MDQRMMVQIGKKNGRPGRGGSADGGIEEAAAGRGCERDGGGVGSFGGALAGFAISTQIGKYLAKNTLTNTFDRKALNSFIKSKPTVLKEVEDYINTLKGTEKARAVKNLELLN